MAPEQIRGRDVSGAADVFSLGAVLAYAATGHAPFSGDSSAVLLYKVVHEEPELGDLEGDLREVVAGCLAKDPDDRPAPADLARTLAPDGAASMVAAGWLPGRLVGEVSRSAVALLDLEPQDAPVGSGPVPFSSASLGAGFGAGPAGGPGSGSDPHAGPGGDVRTGPDSRTGSDTEPGSPPRTASDFSRTGSDSAPAPGRPGSSARRPPTYRTAPLRRAPRLRPALRPAHPRRPGSPDSGPATPGSPSRSPPTRRRARVRARARAPMPTRAPERAGAAG